MQTKRTALLWLMVFLVLNLYVHLAPRLLQQDQLAHWLVYWLTFFILAFVAARYVLRLRGLQAFGLRPHKGWFRNTALGFSVGFGIYAVKYMICHWLGMFEVAGTTDGFFIAMLVAQALLAMLFSSAINDVLIRGYTLAYLRKERLMKGYLLVATVLYILDDSWNEGFQVENMVFSCIIGITFAYTVLRSGSIWLSVGLHWGGNVMYRMLYGFDGQGIWRLENTTEGPLFDYISLFVTALMFPVVYMVLRSGYIKTDKTSEVQDTTPAAKAA